MECSPHSCMGNGWSFSNFMRGAKKGRGAAAAAAAAALWLMLLLRASSAALAAGEDVEAEEDEAERGAEGACAWCREGETVAAAASAWSDALLLPVLSVLAELLCCCALCCPGRGGMGTISRTTPLLVTLLLEGIMTTVSDGMARGVRQSETGKKKAARDRRSAWHSRRTNRQDERQQNNRAREYCTNERFVWWWRRTRREQVQRENYKQRERRRRARRGAAHGAGRALSPFAKSGRQGRIQTVLS